MLNLKRDDSVAVQPALQGVYVRVFYSNLGGNENASLMVLVSLDDPATWTNHILENSRYVRFQLGNNGVLEQFVRSGVKDKFRKTRVTSLAQAAEKINKYLDKVTSHVAV